MLKILKFLSKWSWLELVILALLPFPFVGMPEWGASLLPDISSKKFYLASAALMAACIMWILAILNAGRKPKAFDEEIAEQVDFDAEELNEHLSKALVEIGLAALVFISFKMKDARFALLGGVISLVLYRMVMNKREPSADG